MLHRYCRATEASLQARIEDLRSDVERLNDRFDELLEKSSAREKELLEKILALTNPGALHILRSTSSAQPMPQAAADPGGKRPARPSLLPGSSTSTSTMRSQPRSAEVRPMLSPEAARFRPSAAARESVETTMAEALK